MRDLKMDLTNFYCQLQTLDWLHYIIQVKNIPKDYQMTFSQALVSLRNEFYNFRNSKKWMKYIPQI